MKTRWVRIAYVCVFLLATLTVFRAWSHIGGQGHLDMIPWYWKICLGFGFGVSVVGFTDAVASDDRALNRRSAAWLAVTLLVAGGIAAVTYRAHLNEEVEETDEEGTTALTMEGRRSRRPFAARVDDIHTGGWGVCDSPIMGERCPTA